MATTTRSVRDSNYYKQWAIRVGILAVMDAAFWLFTRDMMYVWVAVFILALGVPFVVVYLVRRRDEHAAMMAQIMRERQADELRQARQAERAQRSAQNQQRRQGGAPRR